MSGDDEIERLLREVDAMNSGKQAKPPARTDQSSPASADGGLSPVGTGVIAGVISGVVVGGATLFYALIPVLPNPSPITAGAGAFVGAFLTGTVLSWRRKR
ncbi:MAG: hypothetical protein U0R68_04200 [Candidatus Nanopelagicales bacterium]